MKIIVFGATGTVGKEVVKQALFNGYTVKAFGRNVFTDLPEDENLQRVQGALFDEGEVFNAIKDCDAVISVIGGATDAADKTRSLGIKNIVKQMEKAGLKRIVALGGVGVLDGVDGKLIMEQEDFHPQYYTVSQEHKKALAYLQESTLDWTFVCPFIIEEGEPTGIFKKAADVMPGVNDAHISSGDLALFMIKELEKKEFVHRRVGISS